MSKRLKHILLVGGLLAVLMCLFCFSASAFEYTGSVNDVNLKTFSVNIGGTTLPLSKYPDGSVTPFSSLSESGYANYMTVAEAKEYGITLNSNVWLRSAECMAFARYVYMALYYKYPATATMDNYIASTINPYGSYAYIDKISSVWSGGSYSATDFANLIKSCYPGSFIRQGGHSMVIMAIFNDGLIVYDANGMGNYNEVDVRKYTWQQYINTYGKRDINAVQIPSYYPGYTYSNGSSGGGVSDYDIDVAYAGTYKVVNVSSYLNVRSGPGTNYSSVGSVTSGVTLEVLGTYNGWAAVEYNGADCWISLDFLELVALKPVVDGYQLDISTAGTYQINSPNLGYLNVRDLPTTSSNKEGTIAHGTVITVVGTYNGWAAFLFDGEYCWVSTDYLKAYTGEVTIYFDAAGGSCDTSSKAYQQGAGFGSLPTPTKSERVFIGWYYGDVRYSGETMVPTESITLTAKWGILSFYDVSENAWYAPAVTYVYKNKMMFGTSTAGDSFNPGGLLTRAEAAQVLYNLSGLPSVSSITQAFSDVTSDAWYYNAVQWGYENGLMYGNEGKFSPSDYITRQDFVCLIYRYVNYCGGDTSNRTDASFFKDYSETADYAIEALQWAVAAGVIHGSDEGYVMPRGNASRGEIAQILRAYYSN